MINQTPNNSMSDASSFKCLEVPTTGQAAIKAYFFIFELPISGTVTFNITHYTAPDGETKGKLKVSYEADTGSSTSVMMMIRDQKITLNGTSTAVDFSNTELELYKKGEDTPKIKGKIQKQTTTKLFEDDNAAIADDELRYKVVNYQDSAKQSNYFLLFASRTSQKEHSNLLKVAEKSSTVLECSYNAASGSYLAENKVAAIGFTPSPNQQYAKAEIKGVKDSGQTIDYTKGVVNC